MCHAFERIMVRENHWFYHWFRERVVTGWWWLGPLSLSITLAGGKRDWFFRTIAAMFALIVLRLFDDLADVAQDRQWHPERTLCRLHSLVQPYVVCGFGLAMSALLVALVGSNLGVYLIALVLVASAARMRQTSALDLRVVFAHVVLLKVPALAIALFSPEAPMSQSWIRALCLYGFVGVYEVLHDARARVSRWASLILGIDLVCLGLGLTLSLASFHGRGE
jgi:hypothetical protein